MNREIKFRAWDKSLSKYKYPELWDSTMPSNWKDWYILQQYTGLKDKNGIEIYEGDIYESLESEYIVVFFEGAFCGHRIDKNPELSMPIGWSSDEQYSDELSPDYFYSEIEVIGNIYQNPELLK